ncbi:MAG: VanZ family protein [Myxococcales bacterium]|nr:VanZ family protein [Myxococcales bacterium]
MPLSLYVALIFSLSSIQTIPFNLSFDGLDKLVHGLEYSIFAFLLLRALATLAWPTTSLGTLFFCWILVVVFAAADEIYQGTVPGRDSSAWDALADVLGAVLGSLIYFGLSGLRVRKRSPDTPQGAGASS